jgi:DNA polymerase-3 subunit gamma/tau
MNLYLKYRPRTIDELDLSGVRKTLGDMVSANNLAHAYLLTGPRGAGKTSTARVMARIVNCEHNGEKLGEPCNNAMCARRY